MEVITLDIINAIINSLQYANPKKLIQIKKVVALSTMISINYDDNLTYKVFMSAMFQNISTIGLKKMSDDPKEKRNRIYRSTEIIRVMPEMLPFQYNIADIILEINERLDGSGHPSSKTKIKEEAQIIGIVEDYFLYEDIKLLKNEEKYSQKIVHILEKVLLNSRYKSIIEDEKLLSDYVDEKINTYNVYKEEIEGVEEEQFLSMVAAIIDAKHSYTGGHSKRVATYSYVIAQSLGYKGEKLTELRYASYLHDIGKLAIDVDLLEKNTKLTDEEYEKIKIHAKYSYEILQHTPRLSRFAFGALHHERIDGKGYPFGLVEKEIPEGAKIIAIADILDALTSNRSYRKPFTFQEAFELMDMMSGTALDENILKAAKICFNIEIGEDE